MENQNKYKPTYKHPALVLKENNISRSDWLKHYYGRDKVYDKIMPLMEQSMLDMEEVALTNKFNASAIFNVLEYWFPDIYCKIKLSKADSNREKQEILKTAINMSGVEYGK